MSTPRHWKYLPNITSALVIVLLLALYIPPFSDLDFALLIRLGELIVTTGELRPPESFSYTINGTDVPDYEWLFEVAIWGVWTAFGYGGLKLFKVFLVGGTLLLVAGRLHSDGVRWHGIALSSAFAVVVLAASWNLRPMYFTTMGVLVVSWWLHDHCVRRRPLSWWLPVVMWIWANVHPGVITGQGLLLGAIAWEWLNRWIRLNPPLEWPACWRLTLIGGVGFAATFLSPDPVGRFLAPFQPAVRHPIMRIFEEMRPMYEIALAPPYTYVLVYLLASLVLLTVVLRFRQYRLWEIALLAGTAGLANMATRGVQDWTLVMLSLGVPHMVQLLNQAAQTDRRRWWVATLLRLDRSCKSLMLSPAFRFQWTWPSAALAVLAVVSLIPPLARDMPIQARTHDPVQAVNWIQNFGLPGEQPWRIFAPPDYGAYLVWRLGDNVRCYADTRGFCYPPKLIEDAHYIPQLGPNWQIRLHEVLEGDTEFFFLETTGLRGELWRRLKYHELEPLYADEKAVVLTAEQMRRGVKRIEENEELAEK